MSRGRLLLWGVVACAGAFALLGGQYSTFDLMSQGAAKKQLRRAIDSLQRQVDSLEAYRKALATNPRLQERIARETWGMSREGEIVYKFRQ